MVPAQDTQESWTSVCEPWSRSEPQVPDPLCIAEQNNWEWSKASGCLEPFFAADVQNSLLCSNKILVISSSDSLPFPTPVRVLPSGDRQQSQSQSFRKIPFNQIWLEFVLIDSAWC